MCKYKIITCLAVMSRDTTAYLHRSARFAYELKMSGSPNLHQGFVNAMGFNDKPNPEEREIGDQCVWTVSSCKHGYGVKNLRDGQRDTYWQ